MRHRFALLFVLCLVVAGAAAAKSLYWKSIDVDAAIDRSGLLHVAETQTFVFDGDWNGGERTFNIRGGQALKLEGVDRIDPSGQAIPLVAGHIEQVGHYALDGNRVRWRSRLANDPEFSHAELTYRIRYILRGVLRGRRGEYRLDHDFAFPDRAGMIQRFNLRLTVDPVWSGLASPMTMSRTSLPPGEGVVVHATLHYGGTGLPAGANTLPNPATGRILALLLLAGVALLAWRFARNERERGRFGGLTPLESIDDAWLETNVFAMKPEMAGAALDNKVGSPEVAAVLAGLAQEKKIESSVEPKKLGRGTLHMRLLVDRKEIDGYARSVVNKLFFDSRKETDTDAVRQHYRSSGLDLAAIIRGPIEEELKKLPHWSEKVRVVNWKRTIAILLAALAFVVYVAFRGGNDSALASTCLFFGAIGLFGSLIGSRTGSNSRALTRIGLRFTIVFAFSVPLLCSIASYVFRAAEFVFHLPALLAAVAWTLAVFNTVFDALRTDEAAEKIAFRKRLVSAREFFIAQLRNREPHLRDSWFPYLLAFGLSDRVDSWFRAFGGAAAVASASSFAQTSSSSSSFGGSESAGGGGWTGGGGAFGGAGATGSWALAATALGSGVAAPSSSSGGGGGGGGGGSSSGGGGGGGW